MSWVHSLSCASRFADTLYLHHFYTTHFWKLDAFSYTSACTREMVPITDCFCGTKAPPTPRIVVFWPSYEMAAKRCLPSRKSFGNKHLKTFFGSPGSLNTPCRWCFLSLPIILSSFSSFLWFLFFKPNFDWVKDDERPLPDVSRTNCTRGIWALYSCKNHISFCPLFSAVVTYSPYFQRRHFHNK